LKTSELAGESFRLPTVFSFSVFITFVVEDSVRNLTNGTDSLTVAAR